MMYSGTKKYRDKSRISLQKRYKPTNNKSNIVFTDEEINNNNNNNNNNENIKTDLIKMLYKKKIIKCIPFNEEKKKIIDHLVLFVINSVP